MANEFKAPNGIDFLSQKAINVADGSNPNDAVNYQQLVNAIAGQSWKQPVKAATTANITLSAPQTIDTVSVVAEDRVLVKNQTTGGENGVYVVKAGAWVRATDMDSSSDFQSAVVPVQQGTTNGDKAFLQTTDGTITVGTTATSWTQLPGSGSTYTAGNGLTLTGSSFSVLANGSSIDVGGSGIKLATAAGGAGLTVSGTGVADVGQGTGISVGTDSVAVDTSVVVRKYTTTLGAVTAGSPVTVTHNLGNEFVMAVVYLAGGTKEQVLIPPSTVDANSFTLTFSTSQAAGYYRVVVQG